LLVLAALLSLPAIATAVARFDVGAWSAMVPDDPAEPCELTTGGYDHAASEQEPLLLIALYRDKPAAPLRVNVMADTALTQAELLRADARLRVDGPRARTVALLPAAIVETERETRVTFRPRFAGGEQAGLRDLVEAMRRGQRVTVEINGRALEPGFSLRGLNALWQRAVPDCEPRP